VGLTEIAGETFLVAEGFAETNLSAMDRFARTTVSSTYLIHTASSIHWPLVVEMTVINFDGDKIGLTETLDCRLQGP